MPFTINIRNQELILLPEKSIWWPQKKALIMADLHLGKSTHFRNAGIGVPVKAEYDNLIRLDHILSSTQATSVFFLGDLFHSKKNNVWYTFKDWMERWMNIRFFLILGNHDILPLEEYYKSPLVLLGNSFAMEPFLLTHEPSDHIQGLYNLCGHLHPGVRIEGQAKQKLVLPCFYFGDHTGILPAFGAFTGISMIAPLKKDKVYVIAADQIIEMK
ncbi:MAG TPA: ligase-associated DNA damage response endonuclease PdeM [Saprospiraceae bacterium]|nr:ligase-associated DNA damage response endonuclease PdeM [Saprospiraceae bacterium]